MSHVHLCVSVSIQFEVFLEALQHENFLFHVINNKVLDLTEKISKGHRVFINSPLEKCNLSLLLEGGLNENVPMSPSGQFFF